MHGVECAGDPKREIEAITIAGYGHYPSGTDNYRFEAITIARYRPLPVKYR